MSHVRRHAPRRHHGPRPRGVTPVVRARLRGAARVHRPRLRTRSSRPRSASPTRSCASPSCASAPVSSSCSATTTSARRPSPVQRRRRLRARLHRRARPADAAYDGPSGQGRGVPRAPAAHRRRPARGLFLRLLQGPRWRHPRALRDRRPPDDRPPPCERSRTAWQLARPWSSASPVSPEATRPGTWPPPAGTSSGSPAAPRRAGRRPARLRGHHWTPALVARARRAGCGVTHLFFCTWSRQDTEAENIEVNGAMLRNVLDAVGAAGRSSTPRW